MTPSQEDMALRSCYPMYNEWCNEDSDNTSEEDIDLEDDAQDRINYLLDKERVAGLDKEERLELENLL